MLKKQDYYYERVVFKDVFVVSFMLLEAYIIPLIGKSFFSFLGVNLQKAVGLWGQDRGVWDFYLTKTTPVVTIRT